MYKKLIQARSMDDCSPSSQNLEVLQEAVHQVEETIACTVAAQHGT
jgi:hypothetical protein